MVPLKRADSVPTAGGGSFLGWDPNTSVVVNEHEDIGLQAPDVQNHRSVKHLIVNRC